MKISPENINPSRILVVQLRQIGDVLLCTPAIRALRKRFPDAHLAFLADKVPSRVLEENPHLDEVIVRDPSQGKLEPVRTIREVRRKNFDLVVDFLANPRTTMISMLSGAKLTLSYANTRRGRFYKITAWPEGVSSAQQKLSLLRVLGCKTDDPALEMPVPRRAEEKIENWFQNTDGLKRPLVCLEPFSKWPVLEYPPSHHLELARMMRESWGAAVIICWGPGRKEDADKMAKESATSLHVAPPTDLMEAAALYKKADLWVGNDGGARHLAAGQGTPTFAVFGPTGHEWTPSGDIHQSVTMEGIACRPCNKRYCPEGHHDCMNKFAPEEVFRLLDDFFRSTGGPVGDKRGEAQS